VIGFLSGALLFKNLETAVIDAGGVGYRVRMPLPDLSKLGDEGNKARVYVHTHVREDAIDLFGFLSDDSLELFERLIAVNGVGPKLALSLLSSMEAPDLVSALLEGDEARLCKVPGVGKKTAARMVLELQDRLKKAGISGTAAAAPARAGDDLEDLRSALGNLGYKPAQIDRAVKSVEELAEQGAALEDLVREALRHV
jgi:Holliday junction DNA helicase RuvA